MDKSQGDNKAEQDKSGGTSLRFSVVWWYLCLLRKIYFITGTI